jgi:D-3-phosphoglycerate dehydrogenase
MDILITEDVSGVALDKLGEIYSVYKDDQLWKNPAKLTELLPEAKAVIIRNQTKFTENFIDAAKSLTVIGRAGIGYDNINVEAASKSGIVVCYTPEENTLSTAEHAFALLLGLYRKLPAAHNSTQSGNWQRQKFIGNELYNKAIGILGLGKIGFRVAQRAKAFGMKINAFDKNLSKNDFVVTESGANLMEMDELLMNSDIVSNHLPLNAGTLRLLDISKFKLMKPNAIFINTGRGDTVVEEDLLEALKSNIISGAGLDVRTKEPPAQDGFNKLDNVILTPHIAGLTVEAQNKVVESLAADVNRVLKGIPALNFVNFPLPSNGREIQQG